VQEFQSIEWYKKSYVQMSWDYPFNIYVFSAHKISTEQNHW
jgi:hypothetical protein